MIWLKKIYKEVFNTAVNNDIVKVILETRYLTDEEKKKACIIAKEAGANFVKTSFVFGTEGATIHDVKLMREAVGEELGVKAAGGVRRHAKALETINVGANRIGISSGVKIETEK